MKILYIASRTAETESLALEREITDVQRQLAQSSADPVESIFLPDLTLEELPLALSRHKPDILHISVHGETAGLSFAKEAFEGEGREFQTVTGRALAAFIDPEHRPKLVFLNACDSRETAEQLAAAGIAAVGTSAPITNQAAVAASRLLYERLLGGRTIASAFHAMNHLVQSMERSGTALHLFHPRGQDLERMVLHSVPRIAAKLAEDAEVQEGEAVKVHIGVVGCPAETIQIIFFTADPSFDQGPENRETNLTEVVRDTPRRGEFWTETAWTPNGDFLVAACGITGSGRTYSVSGMLCDALEYYAGCANPPDSYRKLLVSAVTALRRNDGGGLEGWEHVGLGEAAKRPASKSGSKSKRKKNRKSPGKARKWALTEEEEQEEED